MWKLLAFSLTFVALVAPSTQAQTSNANPSIEALKLVRAALEEQGRDQLKSGAIDQILKLLDTAAANNNLSVPDPQGGIVWENSAGAIGGFLIQSPNLAGRLRRSNTVSISNYPDGGQLIKLELLLVTKEQKFGIFTDRFSIKLSQNKYRTDITVSSPDFTERRTLTAEKDLTFWGNPYDIVDREAGPGFEFLNDANAEDIIVPKGQRYEAIVDMQRVLTFFESGDLEDRVMPNPKGRKVLIPTQNCESALRKGS